MPPSPLPLSRVRASGVVCGQILRIARNVDVKLKPQDFVVAKLGPATYRSPLGLSTVPGDGLGDFVPDGARVLYQIKTEPGRPLRPDLTIEIAGPREKIILRPQRCKAAIVTCGGSVRG